MLSVEACKKFSQSNMTGSRKDKDKDAVSPSPKDAKDPKDPHKDKPAKPPKDKAGKRPDIPKFEDEESSDNRQSKSTPSAAAGSAAQLTRGLTMTRRSSPLMDLYDEPCDPWGIHSMSMYQPFMPARFGPGYGPPPPPGWGYVDYDEPPYYEEGEDQSMCVGPDAEPEQSSVDATDGQDDGEDPPVVATGPTGVDLLQEHLEGVTEPCGESVPERLATLVNGMWQGKGKVKKLFDKHLKPDNLVLHRVDLNEEVLRGLNGSNQQKSAKNHDSRLRAIQGTVARAAVPLTTMVNDLISKDTSTTEAKQKLVDVALDGISFLANANQAANQLRRDLLKPHLMGRFAHLCDEKVPAAATTLFGDGLAEKVKALDHTTKLTTGMTRGRGQFRHPYGSQQRWTPYGFPGGYGRGRRGGFPAQQNTFLGKWSLNADFPTRMCHRNSHGTKLVGSSTLADEISPFSRCRTGTRLNEEARSRSAEVDKMADVHVNTADTEATVGELNLKNEDNTNSFPYLRMWKSFKAGRLSCRLHKWAELTSDPVILDVITGLKIPFISEPVQERIPHPIRLSPVEHSVVQEELTALLDKGVIEIVEHSPGEFISNIFLREKRERGKYRMILNLKDLNEFVEYHHFKMDSLESALQLINKDSILASLDFKDAYYSVAIHPDFRKYLRFQYEGKLYQFTALPNGLACGPRIFTKIMKVPLAHLRQNYGITISGYLDDTISVEDTPPVSKEAIEVAANLLQELGFMINVPKSAPEGAFNLEHLGFLVDSHLFRVSIPEGKVESLIDLVKRNLKKDRFRIREAAQVTGALLATSYGNRHASLFTRSLEIDKIRALRGNRFDFEGYMSWSDESICDLKWWIENLAKVDRPIRFPDPDFLVQTDASTKGWGAHVPETGETCGTRWTVDEAEHHINYLELLAIYFTLQAIYSEAANKHIRIMTDNMTALANINNQGSTHSLECNSLARKIWNWAYARNVWLSAAHIPGKDNIQADAASRKYKDELEWAMADGIFQFLCNRWGKPEIDLFASRLNNKARVFCSWRAEPGAAYTDAFSIKWTGQFCYAFPPFCLLGKVLQKFQADGGRGIIIAPFWPTAPWFSKLANMLTDIPIIIKVSNEELYLPSSERTHPLAGRLRLMAARVSCDPTDSGDFHRAYPRRCCVRNESPLENSITVTPRNGECIVARGALIPTKVLLPKDWVFYKV